MLGITSPAHDSGQMRLMSPHGSQNSEFAARNTWVSSRCHLGFIGRSPWFCVAPIGAARGVGSSGCGSRGQPRGEARRRNSSGSSSGIRAWLSAIRVTTDATVKPVRAREVREEPIAHDRQHPGHLVHDVLGLDVDQAPERVGVLELHDEAQHGLEARFALEPATAVGDPVVVLPLLVPAERLEQRLLRREPPIQGRPGHPGGGAPPPIARASAARIAPSTSRVASRIRSSVCSGRSGRSSPLHFHT